MLPFLHVTRILACLAQVGPCAAAAERVSDTPTPPEANDPIVQLNLMNQAVEGLVLKTIAVKCDLKPTYDVFRQLSEKVDRLLELSLIDLPRKMQITETAVTVVNNAMKGNVNYCKTAAINFSRMADAYVTTPINDSAGDLLVQKIQGRWMVMTNLCTIYRLPSTDPSSRDADFTANFQFDQIALLFRTKGSHWRAGEHFSGFLEVDGDTVATNDIGSKSGGVLVYALLPRSEFARVIRSDRLRLHLDTSPPVDETFDVDGLATAASDLTSCLKRKNYG